VGLFCAAAAWPLLRGVGNEESRTILTIIAAGVGFGVAFFVHADFERCALRLDDATTGRFLCRFRERQFIFSGPEKTSVFDTASIVGFIGDSHLSLVLVDGQTVTLAMRMAARAARADRFGFARALPCRTGVFTNLTHDHLDAPGSPEHYLGGTCSARRSTTRSRAA